MVFYMDRATTFSTSGHVPGMSTSTVRYRYRAYPDRDASVKLSRTFGCCRVVYNDYIAAKESAYKNDVTVSAGELARQCTTLAKDNEDRAWLAEVSSVPLQQAVRDAQSAYSNYFASRKGTRKGPKMGHPAFRKRQNRQSARFTKSARFKIASIHEKRAVLTLPKIGDIPFVLSRPLPSAPSSVTVIREADGRTYVSFVVRVQDHDAQPSGRVCGVDAGLRRLAIVCSVDTDSGEETPTIVANPKYLRSRLRALARSQRSSKRMTKGSKNNKKAARVTAALHRKVRESRLDYAHKVADVLVDTHDVICVETLDMATMARTQYLTRSVADTGVAQFLRLVEEKSRRRGRTFVKVGQSFPSTQLCSSCGELTGPQGLEELHVHHWTCRSCGVSHDRDINAARNILVEGLRLLASEQSEHVADGRSETLNACGAGEAVLVAGGEAGRESEGPHENET